MTVNHAPATPLPWHDCYLNWVQPISSRTQNAPQSNLPRDNSFVLHACNAYPRLVELLKLAANGEHLAFKRAARLLRELGELT